MHTQDHPSDGISQQPKTRKGVPSKGAPGRPSRSHLQIVFHTTADEADMERATALLQVWIQRRIAECRTEDKEAS